VRRAGLRFPTPRRQTPAPSRSDWHDARARPDAAYGVAAFEELVLDDGSANDD
jgi:hypothetical protein